MRKLNRYTSRLHRSKSFSCSSWCTGSLLNMRLKKLVVVYLEISSKRKSLCPWTQGQQHAVKTGVIEDDPVTGLTKIAEPVGVICITQQQRIQHQQQFLKHWLPWRQCTQSFCLPPSAQEPPVHAYKSFVMQQSQLAAPENCVQWITPAIHGSNSGFDEPRWLVTILATGGNAMVKAAYLWETSLWVGAGNVPATSKICWPSPSSSWYRDAQIIWQWYGLRIWASGYHWQGSLWRICRRIQAIPIPYFVNKKKKLFLEEFLLGAKANSKTVLEKAN